MVEFWEMNNQAMEVDAEKHSSRQINWFFNYMCYTESKLKALIQTPFVVDNCMLRYLADCMIWFKFEKCIMPNNKNVHYICMPTDII
jgi:hypothetical protein